MKTLHSRVGSGASPRASFAVLSAWSFYEWANAAFPTIIRTFIFASYFTQAIAVDPVKGTQQWGYALALSSLIIAILSPFLGAIADQEGRRKPWIAFFTLLTVLSSGLLWFSEPSPSSVNWTLTFIILGSLGFGIAPVFYNAMIGDLVSENRIGKLSGFSWGLGYIGSLVSLILALFIIQNETGWSLLDANKAEPIRLTGPLTGLWLLIFSIPFFAMVPDNPKKNIGFKKAIVSGIQSLLVFIRSKDNKSLLMFLLANMLYMDGLNTIFAFGGIYAASVFGFSPPDIVKLGIAMSVAAGLGSALFACLDDYWGSRKTITLTLFLLTFSVLGLLLAKTRVVFWVFCLILSVFVGPVQAASRSFMTHIAPAEKRVEMFGLFALSGRVTAFLGPWLLAMVTLVSGSQKLGFASVLIFLVSGLALLMVMKVHGKGEADNQRA